MSNANKADKKRRSKFNLNKFSEQIKKTITEHQTSSPDPTSDTYSPEMDALKRELILIQSKITNLSKGLKKQEKLERAVLDGIPLIAATMSEMRVTSQNDELGKIYDIAGEFETFRHQKGLELNSGVAGSNHKLIEFSKVKVNSGLQEKKRYDTQRKILDQAYDTLDSVNKNKKSSKEKKDLAAKDLEDKITMFSLTGENTFNGMLDISDSHEFENSIQVCNYLNSYYQYFQAGFQFLSERKEEIEAIKRAASNEKANFLDSRNARKEGVWLPESLGGGKNKVYGVDYDEVIVRLEEMGALKDGIPKFLLNMIEEIEARGLDCLGIFRLSGSKSGVDSLKDRINKGDVDPDVQYEDENVLAGAFKLYLREMPRPLFTKALYADLMSIVDMETNSAIERAKECMALMPTYNESLITRLLMLCKRIENYSAINKMSSPNLAIVLAPNVFAKGDDVALTGIEKENGLFAFLIDHFDEIFDDIELDLPPPPTASGAPSDVPPPPSSPPDAPPSAPSDVPPPPSSPPDAPPSRPQGPPPSAPPSLPPPSTPPSDMATIPEIKIETIEEESEVSEEQIVPHVVADEFSESSEEPIIDTIREEPESSSEQAPEELTIDVPDVKPVEEPVDDVPDVKPVEEPVEEPVEVNAKNFREYPLDAISVQEVFDSLQNGKNTSKFARQIYTLFGATFSYCSEVYKMEEFEVNCQSIYQKFTVLAGIMKQIIVIVPEYSENLPPTLAQRLVLSVNSVKDKIRDSIPYLKELSTGVRNELFRDGVVELVADSYTLLIEVSRVSLMDGISHPVLELSSYISQLWNTVGTENLDAIPFISENISHYSKKILSVLTFKARFCEPEKSTEVENLVDQIIKVVSDLMKQATGYAENPEPSAQSIKLICQSLMDHCASILQMRIPIEENLIQSTRSFSDFVDIASDSIDKILDNTPDPNSNMSSILSELNILAISTSQLKSNDRDVFTSQIEAISGIILRISKKVNGIISTLDPSSGAKVTLSKYLVHFEELKSSVELTGAAKTLEIVFDGFTFVNSAYYLGEFVQLCSTLLETLRET